MNKFCGIILLIVTICTFSCSSGITPEELKGKWETVVIDVQIHSTKGMTDSLRVFQADSTNWLKKTGYQPFETIFKENTYNTFYKRKAGRINQVFSGTWSLDGGEIVMDERTPKKINNRFTIEKTGQNEITLTGFIDYDFDGQKDDEMYQVLQKVPPQRL